MKKLANLALLLLTLSSTAMAYEYQSIDGAEAYEKYSKLPGKACQEYRLSNYVVYTKYQTNSCQDEQTDSSKWNCTVQLELKNNKVVNVISANCSREIQ